MLSESECRWLPLYIHIGPVVKPHPSSACSTVMSAALQNLVNLVATSATRVALNPIVTTALLWILTKGPPQLRRQLTNRIPALRDSTQYAQIVKALKVCLALGIARVLNKQLNHVALNSGRLRSDKARWNWSCEVAVVTGGCSGIGELVVKKLISKDIRVAVLDIRQLPPSLQSGKSYPCTTTYLIC